MKSPLSTSTHLVQQHGSPLRERCTDMIFTSTRADEESLSTILFSMMYCDSDDDDSSFYGSGSSFDESENDGSDSSMGDFPLKRQLDPFFQAVATTPFGSIHDSSRHRDTPDPRRTGLLASQGFQQQTPDWSIEFHYQNGNLQVRLRESISFSYMNLLPNEVEFSLFNLIEEPSYRLFAVRDVDGRVYHLGSRDVIPTVSRMLQHLPWVIMEIEHPTIPNNTMWKQHETERVVSARQMLVPQRFSEYGALPVSRLEYQE